MSRLSAVLLIPDTHVPFHDERAWQLMLKVARAIRPTTICHLGDLQDCYRVSSHSKDPGRRITMPEEVAASNEKLDELDDLGAKRKIFVEGNHEDRLRRYLWDKAPELFGMISTPGLLKLEKRGWEYIPYKQHGRIGKLYVTHDVGYSGKYAARRSLETYQHCVVTAHTHRLDYVVEGNASGPGEARVGMSLGWLGDVAKVDYMHRAKAQKDWALAFGVGYLDRETEAVHIQPVPIVNYTCVVNGVLYRG